MQPFQLMEASNAQRSLFFFFGVAGSGGRYFCSNLTIFIFFQLGGDESPTIGLVDVSKISYTLRRFLKTQTPEHLIDGMMLVKFMNPCFDSLFLTSPHLTSFIHSLSLSLCL